MKKWLNLSSFMDVYQEWHAFVEGVTEGFCFWKPRYEPSEECLTDIKNEHHYYVAGRAIGFALLILLLTTMVIWIVKSLPVHILILLKGVSLV